MKKYINTSNYYLSTTTSKIEASGITGTFDVSDVAVDGVTLPTQGYYWVDVDFGDVSKREIFRIVSRDGYTLTYDARISPYGMKTHAIGATVGLRDFSQLLNSLSTNTDNFGEVEKTGDRTIRVRGGKIFASGNATMLYDTVDTDFTIPINSVKYIVLDYELEDDGISIAAFTSVDEEGLTATGKYPIAKITTNANVITEILDLRSNMIYGGGEGDMKAGMYDPEGKQTDAFNMDNMTQGDNNQFVSPAEKEYWGAKQPLLVSGQNIKTLSMKTLLGPGNIQLATINGQDLTEGGNIPLDTILTVGWDFDVTSVGASSYTITGEHKPLDGKSFIIITDSGTFLVPDTDYTYDEFTNTITFTQPLASTERAYIWLMYQGSNSQTTVGSGVITIVNGNTPLGTFNVNQEENQIIDIDAASHEMYAVTQQEYEALLPGAATDGNWYLIHD